MKRRIRTSPGHSRRASARAALIALVTGLGASALACSSDLFHDTKWQSRCDTDPDAAICPQGGEGGASATSGEGSTSAGSTSGSATSGAGGAAATSTGASMVTTASSSTG